MRALDLCLLALACLLMMSKEAKGGAPEFIYAIDNITVAAGREAQVKLTSIHLHYIICIETLTFCCEFCPRRILHYTYLIFVNNNKKKPK